MPEITGIRFKSCGKVYDFESCGVELRKGDLVIVESEFGMSIGTVVAGPRQIEAAGKELKKVLRVATEEDLKQQKDNENFEKEARAFCLEKIMARGLPMKLVCAEVTLDKKRIIFYFTADGRIDFRELVKDLAAKFKTRIEMRQIGVRDKAKLIGGFGLCGKELCCRLFLTSFEPISIKMAKQQDLSLNTGKLSGICGRLMCCLGYEYHDGSTSHISAAKPEETVEQKEAEIVSPEFQEKNAVVPASACCSVDSSVASPPATQEGQQKPGQDKKQKRKRRFRKRPPQNG